jgi:uncharacterized protein
MTVPSPCKAICVMDEAKKLCLGCNRTLREIAMWGSLSDAEKRRIVDLADQRGRAASASVAAN